MADPEGIPHCVISAEEGNKRPDLNGLAGASALLTGQADWGAHGKVRIIFAVSTSAVFKHYDNAGVRFYTFFESTLP